MNIPGAQPTDSDPTEADQRAIADAMKAGDDAAFAQAVRLFGPRMLAVASRFLQHEQDAQDAVQDAFLSAFRAIDRFHGDSKLSTWLHRIVVNASLMKLRTRKRKPERPIEDLLQPCDANQKRPEFAAGWAVTFDTAVRDREIRELVRKSIDELPESYRIVLLLRDIEEHSTEETAELLELTPGAVKTRLHRARQALRTLLHPHMRGATT